MVYVAVFFLFAFVLLFLSASFPYKRQSLLLGIVAAFSGGVVSLLHNVRFSPGIAELVVMLIVLQSIFFFLLRRTWRFF